MFFKYTKKLTATLVLVSFSINMLPCQALATTEEEGGGDVRSSLTQSRPSGTSSTRVSSSQPPDLERPLLEDDAQWDREAPAEGRGSDPSSCWQTLKRALGYYRPLRASIELSNWQQIASPQKKDAIAQLYTKMGLSEEDFQDYRSLPSLLEVELSYVRSFCRFSNRVSAKVENLAKT